jgi:hypothetical protein
MNEATRCHDQAMAAADKGKALRTRGNVAGARRAFVSAFNLECEAIEHLRAKRPEPAWSIMHRSAAWLAIDAGLFREAERMACASLAGMPHPAIEEELRDALEHAQFLRHLEIRGCVLAQNELQVSLSGHGVGLGVARTSDVMSRIEAMNQISIRVAEWLAKVPFRVGVPSKLEAMESYMSAPRAASFAFTLRMGQPAERQISLFPDTDKAIGVDAAAVMRETQACIGLLQHGTSDDQLRARFKSDDYFENFMALMARVAPDGKYVTQVGFTSQRGKKIEAIALRRKISSQRRRPLIKDAEVRSVTGRLRDVSGVATKDAEGAIYVVSEDGSKHRLEVPSSHEDLVKTYYGSIVRVEYLAKGKRLILNGLGPVDS